MDLEIVKTDTPRRDLLLLADESEESVADYAGRGTTYVARRDGEILGQYLRKRFHALVSDFVQE